MYYFTLYWTVFPLHAFAEPREAGAGLNDFEVDQSDVIQGTAKMPDSGTSFQERELVGWA
jgi:hypothetical protein